MSSIFYFISWAEYLFYIISPIFYSSLSAQYWIFYCTSWAQYSLFYWTSYSQCLVVHQKPNIQYFIVHNCNVLLYIISQIFNISLYTINTQYFIVHKAQYFVEPNTSYILSYIISPILFDWLLSYDTPESDILCQVLLSSGMLDQILVIKG